MADIKITDDLRAILDNCEFTTNGVKLPPEQLDRATYVRINKLLESVGGVWSRKLKAHVFEGDPKEKLGLLAKQEVLVDTQKLTQSYYTPHWLVEKAVKIANVKGKTICEPSCGDGRFIDECYKQGAKFVYGVDIKDYDCKNLVNSGLVHIGDFLQWETDKEYDILIGNPPYNKLQWLKHTIRAYELAKEKLVFILPNSIHSNKKFQDFLVDKVWEFEKVDEGAFKESGTLIGTNIVTIWK